MAARPDAPPYLGEGPHALWHVSEDPGIERFTPHVPATNPSAPASVWAVDTRHIPMFWFPRDCPRGCIWKSTSANADDLEAFFGHTDADRIHVTEWAWLDALRTVQLYAYRLPTASFVRHEVGGYWVSDETLEPEVVEPLRDPLSLHRDAGIDLRFTTHLWPWWRRVACSSLDFSGSRMHNAQDHPDKL